MAIARQPWSKGSTGDIDERIAGVALFVGVAYYLGSLVGFQLTFQPNPISAMWPPNAILLAGLLLVPTVHWPLVLLAALPAHLASQFQSGVPTAMIVGWFVSNC